MQYVWGEKNKKTVKVKCERLHRNEKRESKALWIGRLERSPVVCARWCSLIIHCMRWMSLSPHTAQLYSALCLGAPGSADEPVCVHVCTGWRGLWYRTMSNARLRGYVLRPHTDTHMHKYTDINACAFAQMYVEGSEGFSLELEIGLGLVGTISQCWPMFEHHICCEPALLCNRFFWLLLGTNKRLSMNFWRSEGNVGSRTSQSSNAEIHPDSSIDLDQAVPLPFSAWWVSQLLCRSQFASSMTEAPTWGDETWRRSQWSAFSTQTGNTIKIPGGGRRRAERGV